MRPVVIVYWNTRYIAHAFETLERLGHTVRDDDIRHIHPVHFEHINPFGHYRFDTRRGPAKGRLRPVRPVTYTSRATPATNATATHSVAEPARPYSLIKRRSPCVMQVF